MLAGVMVICRIIMALLFYYTSSELFAMCLYLEVRLKVRGGGVAGQSINQWMLD
jgi:hypothetical protein